MQAKRFVAADMRRALALVRDELGDDAMILGHRLSELCSKGPFLEEDIAMTNISLDLFGQTRMMYTTAGELEGKGRKEDDFGKNSGLQFAIS